MSEHYDLYNAVISGGLASVAVDAGDDKEGYTIRKVRSVYLVQRQYVIRTEGGSVFAMPADSVELVIRKE